MLIDSHIHFWKLDRGDYGWLTPDLSTLYRDFLPDDLAPLTKTAVVSGIVAVQAADSEEETRFLLDLAKQHPKIMGVVGWIDMEGEDALERLDDLVVYGEGYLKGLRPMIQDIEDVEWILKPELDNVFDALVARDLTFDALVKPDHLGGLVKRLTRTAGLKCVIDHSGKPAIADGVGTAWFEQMTRLAGFENVFCKLSGLVTEAGEDWTFDDVAPCFLKVVELFTARRCMWGSDWPVVNLASDYAAWLTFSSRLVEGIPLQDRARIFGETAMGFYRLEEKSNTGVPQ